MRPIHEIELSKIQLADWNPKDEGSPEKMAKLYKSMERDGSYGVPAVRKLPNGTYECIDGNHRIAALKAEGVQDKVRVEDFGEITRADAILISHRRNAQWFEEDTRQFGILLKEVLAESPDTMLDEFMPETDEEIQNLLRMADMSWDQYEPEPGDEPASKPTVLVISVDEQVVELWNTWLEAHKTATGDESQAEALRSALQIALDAELV